MSELRKNMTVYEAHVPGESRLHYKQYDDAGNVIYNSRLDKRITKRPDDISIGALVAQDQIKAMNECAIPVPEEYAGKAFLAASVAYNIEDEG